MKIMIMYRGVKVMMAKIVTRMRRLHNNNTMNKTNINKKTNKINHLFKINHLMNHKDKINNNMENNLLLKLNNNSNKVKNKIRILFEYIYYITDIL